MRPRLVVAVALVGLVAACESPKQREGASLTTAVERFRQAENVEKPARVEAVKAVACTAPEVCTAKAACLAAIEPTAKALSLKAEVERALSDLGSGKLARGSPEAEALPKKLDEAEALLKQGRDAMPRCDEALGGLRFGR